MLMAYRAGFGVLYPHAVASEGWSTLQVTGAFSVSLLISAPLFLVSGVVVDRLGVRFTMLAGTALFGGGLLVLAMAGELWQLYLTFGVPIALGTCALGFPSIVKLLSIRAGPRLGWGLGLFNAGQGLGSLLGSPALQLVAEAYGWRPAYSVLACTILFVLGPLTMAGAPGRVEQRRRTQGTRAARGGGLPRAIFWLVFLGNVGLGYLLLLPTHQVGHLLLVGFPDLLAASAGGVFGACVGVGGVLAGWMTSRWSAGRLGTAGAALICVGVLALIGSRPATAWLLVLYVLAAGLGRGAIGINLAVLLARVFAGPRLGRVSGALEIGVGIGGFAGAYLTALSRDVTGTYVFGLAGAIVAAVAVAACTALAEAKGRPR